MFFFILFSYGVVMKRHVSLLIFALYMIPLAGCATVFKGYEDEVRLLNLSGDHQIFDENGNKLDVSSRIIKHGSRDFTHSSILLRSNQQHKLRVRNNEIEKVITLYPRLGLGWLFVDLLAGGFPLFVDAYTGNWNYFPDADVSLDR